jgi:hypothetical protein
MGMASRNGRMPILYIGQTFVLEGLETSQRQTRIPDGAAYGVALLEEEFHEPGRDEPAGAGDADGVAVAGGAVGRGVVTAHVCKNASLLSPQSDK